MGMYRTEEEIKNWFKESIKSMEEDNNVMDGYYMVLDGDNALVIEWENGFDPHESDPLDIRLSSNPSYGLVYSIKKYNPIDRDIENWDYMQNKNYPDYSSCSITHLYGDEYYTSLAKNVINDYNCLIEDEMIEEMEE